MKKLLAFLLAAALMLGVLAPGLGTLSAFAVGTSKLPSVTSGDLTFVVPETIYLAPDARSWSIATSTPFQFYVNNSQSGATTANAAETTGKIYYSLSGGSGATLSYQFLDASLSAMSGGSVTLSSSSISSGGSVNITGGTSPSLAASANGCYLRWTLSFTEKSIAKKAYAYTYIYKPYVIPVAAAALAGTGTSSGANWAGTLTWLSGMHGISVDGMPDYSYADSLDSYEANNYLKFTEFACFTSSASTAYVGGTAVNVAAQGVATSSWAGHDTGKAGDRRYVVFANTSGTPKSYAYMLFENNREPTSYNNGSSDTNQNWGVRNTTFAKYRGNNKDIVTKAVAKSIGTITIDTSRYSNLNQIPNLAVGLAVTTDKACDDGTGRWWIADISQTSFSHRSTWYKTDEDGLESTAMERDYIFAGQGNNWHTRSYDTNEGIRYAGAWNRTLLNTGNIEQMYYVKSLYGNAEKSAGSNYDANACGYVGLKATYVNKTALRAAVNRAIAKMPALGVTGISGNGMTSCYFDASDANYKWTAFQSAFNEASKGLTRVDTDASTVLSLTNSLNSALDALQTYYTVNGNGGELSNYQNSYTTVGTDQYGIGIVSVRAQRTGYLLQGWNVNPNATAAQAEPANHVTVGYNNTVYAIWAPAVYDINYTLNEGSFTGTYPTNYTIEDDDITLATPVRTGYRFTGWSGTGLTGENNMTVTIPAGSTGERNYTAHWVLDQFTITFDTDGGTPIAPITADYGATITAPPNPTKEGHYFLYWTKNGDVTYLPSTMPAESYTVKANWLINRYVITFDTDGGSEIDPISGVYGTAVTPPADPTKEGYLFASWDPAIPETIPGANLTVTAQWVTPTITFDTDGGSAIAPISQVAGTAVTPPANPTKEGFIFNGWSPALPETMPAENLTVTAQWINPTITFDTNGGSAVAPISQAAGTAITPPADPTKDGFVFSGWDPALPETMPGENLTVTAIWNQLYTATFDLNGGNINGSTIVSPVVLCAGDPLAAPVDPEKDDCVFTGWSPAVPTSMPAENVTYTAQWEPALHTVTFDLNGGNVNGSTANVTDQLHTGDPVTAPDPVRDGYRFLGWEPAVPDVMPASDASFTAVWAKLYTATFCLEGGSINGSTADVVYTLCEGDPLIAPVDPVLAYYAFTGWDPQVSDEMPDSDVTYYATWELLPIEVLRHSLSLNGDIGVNFYVRIPNATRNAYAEFTVAGKTVNVPINLNQYVVLDGERLYRFTCDVHSAQTSLPISGIVYNGDDQSEPFTYSVHTYLDEAMANPITQNNTKFMALASSIATYAYYANELLGYDKNFKQQELFDDSGMAAVTAESLIDSAAQISDTPAGVLYYGSSLILQTTTAIRHYFSLPANTTIDDFTFTLGSGSTAVTLTPIPSGSYYYVEIPNIASGNLGVPYTVTVTDEDGNAVNTWIYSALSYAYRALTSDTVTTQTVNAAKALVLYSQAADAYFHP
ncbi:MAG: InlB B-repeat-containing protein [Clostridia bacterium]|nr:InlB B-repeat-containing protein [Clostridia bacterium]